ncbi:hypothetical protein RCL1_008774 [Eukaryota sp. TZLM3-RCL]
MGRTSCTLLSLPFSLSLFSSQMQGNDSQNAEQQQIQISDVQSHQPAAEIQQQTVEAPKKTLRPPPDTLLSPTSIISPTLKCRVVKTSSASLRRNVLIPQIQQQQSLSLEELPAMGYCSERAYPWMLISVFPRIFACRDGCLYIPKC